MEFLKDYEFELNYHPSKANVVADALSRKSLSISWMMIKETKLIESFQNLNLGISVTPRSIQLSQIKIMSDFKGKIVQAQQHNLEFQKTIALVQSRKLTGFSQDNGGLWKYQGRPCVPVGDALRGRILEEAHKNNFTVHPGLSKMYQDFKRMFWWSRIKLDIAEFVNKYLACQKVKTTRSR